MTRQPLQSTSTNQSEGLVKELTIDDLAELENTLHSVAHKCTAFGLQLGVEDHRLQAIEKKHADPYDQLREILRYRLRQIPLLTWSNVVRALRSNIVREYQLASELKSQYIHQSPLADSPQASATHVSTQTSVKPTKEKRSGSMLLQSTSAFLSLSHHSISQPTPQPPHPGPSCQQLAYHQRQQIFPSQQPDPYARQETPLLSSSNQSALGAPQQQRTPSLHHTAITTPSGITDEDLTAQPSHGQYRRPPTHLSPHHQHTNQWRCNDSAALSTDMSYHPLSYHPMPNQLHQPYLQNQPHPLYHACRPHQLQLCNQAHPPHPPFSCSPFPTPNTPSPSAQSHTHQHMHHTEDGSYSDAVLPPSKRMCHNPLVAQYIRFIKIIYRSSKVERNPNATKWPPTPSKIFINLACIDRNTVVTKQEADEITRCMVCNGSVDVILRRKRHIDFSDITRDLPDTALQKVILVEGAPGVGKSTFAWEFCRKWERGEIAQQYQLVLLLRLRDERVSKAQSLADLILHSSDHIRQAVVEELESTLGIDILIILEGFDELPRSCQAGSSLFLQLIHGQLLPLATVLVTSRPWATQNIHRECTHRIFQHIEILGFTGKQIEEYVTSVFADEGKPPNNEAKENIEEVMSYIKTYPQIKACMYIPLNSAIVVSVYQESKAGKCILPRTLTELYYALTQTLLLRYLYGHPEYGHSEWNIQSLKEDLPHDVYSQLLTISKLAYSGISTDQEDSVQLIYTNLHPRFETLGLMQSVPQLYVTQGVVVSHNFLHLTVQEFLAALHISNLPPEKQLEHFQRQEEGRFRVVLRFVAGLTELANLSPDQLQGLLQEKPNGRHTNPFLFSLESPYEGQITKWNRYNTTPDVELIIQHVQWMFEAQKDDIIHAMLQEKTVEFQCLEGLTPLDYYSLGYCIAHSHSHWVLTFERGTITEEVIEEEEVRMLVAGVNTRHGTTAKLVGMRCSHMTWSFHERRFCGMGCYESGGYRPLSITAENLNVLLVKLKNMIHLQELHLNLPAQCSSIAWPNLSGLRVLHLAIIGEKDWKLDTLFPHLALDSMVIEVTSDGGGLGLHNAVSIGGLFLSSNCPKHVYITDEQSPITADVAVGQHVHEKLMRNRTSLVEENKSVEGIRCRVDWYSLGCVIAHSNFQWVLTVEEGEGKDVVRVLVAGANTRHDTTAKLVGLKGPHMGMGICERRPAGMGCYGSGGYRPLSMSAEALNVLFIELKNIVHLQELHLNLPAQCSSIVWPNLSGLQVLHLAISSGMNWKLGTVLSHLSLKSLTIEPTGFGNTLVYEDCAAIGMLLSSSDCLEYLHFQMVPDVGILYMDVQGMESITKATSDNEFLPLKSLKVECECTFSDTAAHSLALFITNSTTLHHLSIVVCTFSAHGLLELARAIHHSSSLQERKLEYLICTVDGDDEAKVYARLLFDYPHTVDWLFWEDDSPLQWSLVSDKGAESIATALHHNSTLRELNLSGNSISDTGSAALAQALHHNSTLTELNLSNNSISDTGSASLAQALHQNSTLDVLNLSNNSISDTGSAALAQALHHNSTLWRLDLSANDRISAEGTHQLLQAMTVNTSIKYLVLPRRCEEYAFQCPLYSAVKHRIEFQ